MTVDQLFSALHALPRAEKLQLIQIPAADVAREEAAGPFDAEKPEAWSLAKESRSSVQGERVCCVI